MSTSLPFPKHGDIILKSTTKTRAKLHNQCYVQSSFSTIVSQSDNSIDKGIQRLKILQV